MTKISPIAEYLTRNNAISKREGNVWHFFSKDGLYLGRQVKIEDNTSTTYLREIYGEGFKKLFYECVVLIQKCVYYKDNKLPVGMGILPIQTNSLKHFIDFTTNKITNIERFKQIRNPMKLIALDDNTGVGLYEINKPFLFEEKTMKNEEVTLKRRYRIEHDIH